jgi:hypothetical protein
MKYEFFKDTLGTIWYRNCVEIEADSYEEAKQKLIDAVENYDDIEVFDSEPLWETWNETSIKDNDGYATLEIQDPETAEIIYKNGK